MYNNISSNEKLYDLVKEYEKYTNETDTIPKSTLPAFLEKRIEVQISNKNFIKWAFVLLAVIAVYLMFYGFKKWHTVIQPKQDEYFDLQISRLKQEIEAANK